MKDDLPNFAAWQQENLIKFATDSFIRMREQQEMIEQCQRDLKDALMEIRRMFLEGKK